VKYLEWNPEKNEKLKQERGVGFEEIANAIVEGNILGTVPHPNQKQYKSQKIFIVELHDYAYAVPFVEDDKKIFLKTIFPNRKYTREFIEKKRRNI